MKRTKLLLSMLVGLMLVFVMAFAVACNSGDNNNDNNGNNTDNEFGIVDSSSEALALDHISVRGYTSTFTLGTAFSTGNLVVTATLNDYSISDSYYQDVTLEAGEYEVDSSDYNANRVGIYTIYVSYTRANVTRTAHYTVEVTPVTPAYGGIVATLAEGKSDTYALSATSASVTVSKDIVAVYEVGADGEISATPLAADAYEADLYLGSTKIEGNEATANGTYSLVVTLVADSSKQDFIPVYVVNPVVKIELNEVEGAVYEQEASSTDLITGTWSFTVTYSNGTTKTVKVGDALLTHNVDTKSAGSKTATITYIEVDAKGEAHTVTCTVPYTITAKVIEGDSVEYVMYYTVATTDATAKTGSFVTSYGEATGDDTDGNVTITNTASSFLTREKSTEDGSVTLSDYAEIKEGGNKNITITVGEKATNVSVKVYVSHTSSSAPRTAYLASATTADDASKIIDSKTIGGDGNLATGVLHVLEGELEAGTTYHVFTSGSGDTMHVYQVVVTYTVVTGNGGSQTEAPETITVTSDEATGYPDDGTYTEATAWGESGILTILSGCKVNSSKKTVDGEAIQNRLQTAGAATTGGKAIEIDLTGDEYQGYVAKVQVVFYVGSGDTRYLTVLDSTGAEYTAGTQPTENRSSSDQLIETVTLQGGAKYYLGGSNGINIYKIVITFEAA